MYYQEENPRRGHDSSGFSHPAFHILIQRSSTRGSSTRPFKADAENLYLSCVEEIRSEGKKINVMMQKVVEEQVVETCTFRMQSGRSTR